MLLVLRDGPIYRRSAHRPVIPMLECVGRAIGGCGMDARVSRRLRGTIPSNTYLQKPRRLRDGITGAVSKSSVQLSEGRPQPERSETNSPSNGADSSFFWESRHSLELAESGGDLRERETSKREKKKKQKKALAPLHHQQGSLGSGSRA
jgi:hypothetical protein